jgi:hypothetical protein
MALGVRVDQLAADAKAESASVSQTFREMRTFVAESVTNLRIEMNARFDTMDQRFDRLEAKLDRVLATRLRRVRKRRR